MPELPEVETIRRALEPELAGRTIRSVTVARPDIVGYPASVGGFSRALIGRRIERLGRTGKYLVLHLDGERDLIFHLRLSGHLEVITGTRKPDYERVRFSLSGARALSFAEPRVLGRVYAVRSGQYPPGLTGMARMGPEPISTAFTCDFLAAQFRGRTAPVKSLLLDQRVCCGVGNIYSDEALFRAGIRPQRRAGVLRKAEVGRLAASLRSVLNDGIKWCGTTMDDGRYVMPDGASGRFQSRLAVFGREGERCRKCSSIIRRSRIGNRSTHYCPNCQK